MIPVIAWNTAQAVLKESGQARPGMKVAVGLKGAALYGPVLTGQFTGASAGTNDGLQVRAEGLREIDRLYPFFAPIVPKAAKPRQQ